MLKNKIVFITGASSGIGAACAKQFAKAGAKLLLCARRLDKLNEIANPLRAETDVHTFALDVSSRQQVALTLNALPTEWKAIDVLVNNAGLAAGFDPIQSGNIDDWEQMIDTNLKGLLYVTRAVLPQMIERNHGHIINIGSVAGHYVYPQGVVYCATKFGVNALSNGLRMDLQGTKIRVSTVDPGAVETNFSLVRFKGDEKRAAAVYAGIEALIPDDIADTVFFCANRPSHVNISEIMVLPTDQTIVTQSVMARKEK
jgi:3-hydroxy acid dehydrogenase/malonic semialdehyde reductase